MKRRSFISWGSAGLVALCSAIGISLGAVVRFLTPSVFYEPPQSFKIGNPADFSRSEEHTSELQSLRHLVCRLLLEKINMYAALGRVALRDWRGRDRRASPSTY